MKTFLDFGDIINALLLAGGVWWCVEVLRRLREDIGEFRAVPDPGRRAGIAAIWVATTIIALLVINFVWNLAVTIAGAVRDLM